MDFLTMAVNSYVEHVLHFFEWKSHFCTWFTLHFMVSVCGHCVWQRTVTCLQSKVSNFPFSNYILTERLHCNWLWFVFHHMRVLILPQKLVLLSYVYLIWVFVSNCIHFLYTHLIWWNCFPFCLFMFKTVFVNS